MLSCSHTWGKSYTNMKVYSWTQHSFAVTQWPVFIVYKKNDEYEDEGHLTEEKHGSQRR